MTQDKNTSFVKARELLQFILTKQNPFYPGKKKKMANKENL